MNYNFTHVRHIKNNNLNCIMKTFYITTPIYYVNSDPHVGSAYTTLFADLMAKFYRLDGYDTKFLTGTDEHGQKIEQSAKKLNQDPQRFVDTISQKFRDLVKLMEYTPNYFSNIQDNFIRTTMSCHVLFIQNVWRQMVKNGWLYEGTYKGWYCVSDEAYYGEDELTMCEDGKLKTALGKEVEWKEEKTYFFKLSELQNTLLKVYEKFPNLIKPFGKKTEVVSFVSGLSMKDYEAGEEPKKDYLKDLSVSRNTFEWGIKIPCDINGNELLDEYGNWKPEVPQDERHVIYVWFDALFNYLTAIGCGVNDDYKKYWLDNSNKIHLIGKDILRPHAVYWPAFLIAYNYSLDEIKNMKEIDDNFKNILPTTIFAHGWLTNEGQKISKSLGNAIVPYAELEWLKNGYGIDIDLARDYLKYYLITTTPFGNDGDYSRIRLVEKINGDLSNKVGNLTKRTMDMIYKNCNGKIPTVDKFDILFTDDISTYENFMSSFNFDGYIDSVMRIAENANKYLDDNAPWKLSKEGKTEQMESVLYSIANTIMKIAMLLQPIVPYISKKILKELGLEFDDFIMFDRLNENLEQDKEIQQPTIIIPRLQSR